MAKYFAGGHLRFLEGAWRDDNGDPVDVVEVRHGKWIEHETAFNRFECSECGSFSFYRYKHCPNCGAKMDGKDE